MLKYATKKEVFWMSSYDTFKDIRKFFFTRKKIVFLVPQAMFESNVVTLLQTWTSHILILFFFVCFSGRFFLLKAFFHLTLCKSLLCGNCRFSLFDIVRFAINWHFIISKRAKAAYVIMNIIWVPIYRGIIQSRLFSWKQNMSTMSPNFFLVTI